MAGAIQKTMMLDVGIRMRIRHAILFVLPAVIVGCGRQDRGKVVVEAYEPRPIVITKNGELLFESNPLTESNLIAMVKERVEKDMRSQIPSQYATIIVEPDPETPYGKVREVKELIMKHGGTSASRYNSEESPTTN
jgi:hypothetical protein